MIKSINRRSFFTKAVGLVGLLLVLPDKVEPVIEETMIKTDADGLEEKLEAHMWKILKHVQIRASQEPTEFLLGR